MAGESGVASQNAIRLDTSLFEGIAGCSDIRNTNMAVFGEFLVLMNEKRHFKSHKDIDMDGWRPSESDMLSISYVTDRNTVI
jgi:hypothetical protein